MSSLASFLLHLLYRCWCLLLLSNEHVLPRKKKERKNERKEIGLGSSLSQFWVNVKSNPFVEKALVRFILVPGQVDLTRVSKSPAAGKVNSQI